MSNSYYSLYVDGVLDLVKTIVVKSEITADCINKGLAELQIPVDEHDPTSWKYYMNLAGEYHATDVPMTVKSVDTLEEIPFTKEVLEIHRGTAREYSFGNHYYNDLLTRYPEQEMLILGILNPLDMTTAIEAKDGEILWYDESLVESNETTLIYQLQQWIDAFLVRWYNAPYNGVDDLYAGAFIGIMFIHMPKALMNIRKRACKTVEVHSYHIQEYLASHGRLDRYLPYLTKEQALFLYRDIEYIYNHNGKQETFDLLVEKILTLRGFPLAEYKLRHNLSQMPNNLLPDVEVTRRELTADADDLSIFSVRKVLELEVPSAPDNADVLNVNEEKIIEDVSVSTITEYPTKILESKVVDRTDSTPFTFAQVLLNHWLYLSNKGNYKTVVTVEDPLTGDKIPLQVKDAFIVYLWCYNRSIGLELEDIPIVDACRVVTLPYPTVEELKAITLDRYVDPRFYTHAFKYTTPIRNYVSTEAFYELCEEIHENMHLHRQMYQHREHLNERAHVQAMCDRFYCDRRIVLSELTTYRDWFNSKGLDFSNLSELECSIFAQNILATATGADLRSKISLGDIHKAMLDIMAQLSSYSLQYIQSINSDPIQVPDSVDIRLGDHYMKGLGRFYPSSSNVKALEVNATAHAHVKFKPTYLSGIAKLDILPKAKERWDCVAEYDFKGHEQTVTMKVRIPTPNVVGFKIIDEDGEH